MNPLFSKKECKQQYWYRDTSTREAAPGAFPCVSVIIAIQDGTTLAFRGKDGSSKVVRIPVGMGIAFRCDRVHADGSYKSANWRLHCVIKKKHHQSKGNVVITPILCPHNGYGRDFFNVTDQKAHSKSCSFNVSANHK